MHVSGLPDADRPAVLSDKCARNRKRSAFGSELAGNISMSAVKFQMAARIPNAEVEVVPAPEAATDG